MGVARTLFAAIVLVYGSITLAQQAAKMPRVGFLSAASESSIRERAAAFRQGLRERGYVEGRNIRVEYRWTDGDLNRLPKVIAELQALKVDVIVSAGPAVTRGIKRAGVKIPVVMAFDHDPVGSGFVASLARPGANITGLSTLTPETSGKQLELLKEVLPKLSRVAIIADSTVPGNMQAAREIERIAASYGLQLQHLEVRASRDFEAIFQAARDARSEAMVLLTSPLATAHRSKLIDLAHKSRLPTIYYALEFVNEGGLMTYSANIPDLFRRSAMYVDRILKGEAPANLPVQQPLKFDFVINLKAARAIGLTIPTSVLTRADKVIQ